MDRRWLVVVAVAALFVTAGCLGGGDEPTPTATPEPTTTEVPQTTTEQPTTAKPTATPTTTTTTTHEPQPNVHADLYRQGDGPVYDGDATFTVELTNTGASGEFVYNVTLVRQEGGDFDRTATGTVEVGANERVNRTVTVEFRATGTYVVSLNGEREATIDVRGLRVSGGGGGSDSTTTTTTETTTTTATTTDSEPGAGVTGETNPGAE